MDHTLLKLIREAITWLNNLPPNFRQHESNRNFFRRDFVYYRDMTYHVQIDGA